MFRVSERDSNGLCWSRGQAFEAELKKAFVKRGYRVRPSTQEEDYKLHADFWAYSEAWGRWVSVDAKAMKRIQRNGELQDEFTYVEWKNNAGYAGWLQCGADVLCFERSNDILVVTRVNLHTWCEEVINREKKAVYPADSLYCSYSRQGRSDEISLIRLSDIPNDKVKIWSKDNV